MTESIIDQVREASQVRNAALERPLVITLCGDTRHPEAFAFVQHELTLNGRIVLSVGLVNRGDIGTGDEIQNMQDALNMRKIDISDAIFVINPEGFIDDSTAEEIMYAQEINKDVYYLVESS